MSNPARAPARVKRPGPSKKKPRAAVRPHSVAPSWTNWMALGAAAALAPPEEKPLTGKQAAFVRWYTTPGETLFNGTRAAEKAGYAGDDNTLHVMAYENLHKPHVARAIQIELSRSFSTANLSVERVLRDVELVRQLALREGKYQAALKASDLMGKYLKMWTQKIEHLHTIEDASSEELLSLLGTLLKQVDGINLTGILAGNESAGGRVSDPAGAPTTH
jgi:hypothetical protein